MILAAICSRQSVLRQYGRIGWPGQAGSPSQRSMGLIEVRAVPATSRKNDNFCLVRYRAIADRGAVGPNLGVRHRMRRQSTVDRT
jgi:hypothetical protein